MPRPHSSPPPGASAAYSPALALCAAVLRQLLKDARAPSAGSRDAATDCRAATRALSFWAAVVDVPVEGFQGQLQRAIPG